MKLKVLTYLTIVCLLASSVRIPAEPDPVEDPQPAWILACFVVGAGVLAGVGIYVVTKSCNPKYYCMKDSDGKYWVGTATKKEREVNDWVIVSGPYDSVAQGTNNCPPPPGQMTLQMEPPDWTIRVQESTNLLDWVTIHETRDDPFNLNFTFFPTNNNAPGPVFYRATATPF